MTGPRPAEPTKDILNIDEAALLLGVSTKTFAKVLREGHIPGRKIGREWKFSRRALIDWVGAGASRDFLDIDDGRDDGRETEAAEGGAGAPMQPYRAAKPQPPRRNDAEMSVEED